MKSDGFHLFFFIFYYFPSLCFFFIKFHFTLEHHSDFMLLRSWFDPTVKVQSE